MKPRLQICLPAELYAELLKAQERAHGAALSAIAARALAIGLRVLFADAHGFDGLANPNASPGRPPKAPRTAEMYRLRAALARENTTLTAQRAELTAVRGGEELYEARKQILARIQETQQRIALIDSKILHRPEKPVRS